MDPKQFRTILCSYILLASMMKWKIDIEVLDWLITQFVNEAKMSYFS